MKLKKTLPATALALGLGVTLAIGIPLSASAHVTLDDNTAEAGSYALLTFKVPNESDAATTTSVTVSLPSDTPFVSVRTVPVAGWTAEVIVTTLPEPVQIGETTITEAPTSIVWTATGTGLGASELGLFPFSVGPVPDVGHLELPVDQGYSDGSVVSWAGEDVPVLYVNDEPAGDHHGDDAESDDAGHDDAESDDAESGDAGTDDEDAAASAGPDGTAIAGVALGSAGLLLGGTALALTLMRRREAS
jgi:uncharacterized protein YcnI